MFLISPVRITFAFGHRVIINMSLDPDVIAAGDLSAARIGKLSAAGDKFEVENVGELEFEAEENELSLTVESVVGEFAVFAPIEGAAVEGAVAGAGNATAGAGNATAVRFLSRHQARRC